MRLVVAGVVAFVAVLLAFVYFQGGTGEEATIEVITSSPIIEKELAKFRDTIGDDYEGYKGHLYRVLTYAIYFLNGTQNYRKQIEKALVYHDIGLWTDSVLNYPEPSFSQAKRNMDMRAWEKGLIRDIILYHHKITSFSSQNGEEYDAVVNAVRKADWIDATKGLVSHGMSRANIRKTEATVPNAGFHATLLGFGTRLHGLNVPRAIWELGKIYHW